jgi:hypothetical protein
VASVDIPIVARRRPGSPIRFVAVDVGEAEQARREQERALEALAANLARAPKGSGLDLERLYSSNLISGVSSAGDPERFGRLEGSR